MRFYWKADEGCVNTMFSILLCDFALTYRIAVAVAKNLFQKRGHQPPQMNESAMRN